MSVVEVGVQELVYQVAVAAMNLHTVESCFASQIHSLSELPGHGSHLFHTQAANQGRAVQVETCAGTDRETAADILVAHITAMSQLNAGSSTGCMDAVSKMTQVGDYLGAHIQLTVKTQTALCNGSIGNGGHSHAALSNAGMIVI